MSIVRGPWIVKPSRLHCCDEAKYPKGLTSFTAESLIAPMTFGLQWSENFPNFSARFFFYHGHLPICCSAFYRFWPRHHRTSLHPTLSRVIVHEDPAWAGFPFPIRCLGCEDG